MNEIKKPQKPLMFYYAIVLLVVMLFNLFAVPALSERRITETDYGSFMTLTEEKKIDQVQIQDNKILFTVKGEEGVIYKTGVMDDPTLALRLHEAGAKFSPEIVEEASPIASFLMTWILPIVLFTVLGQYMSK